MVEQTQPSNWILAGPIANCSITTPVLQLWQYNYANEFTWISLNGSNGSRFHY